MTTATIGVDTRDMLVVHDALRREWGRAPGLVRAVEAGDTRRAEVVAAHLDLQAAMLHHHHEGEDRVLWPVLMPRVPEAVAPALLARILLPRLARRAYARYALTVYGTATP